MVSSPANTKTTPATIDDHSPQDQSAICFKRIQKSIKMKSGKSYLAKTISYYEPLLIRYARRMVHNETEAEKLVYEVLQTQYDRDELKPSQYLRSELKNTMWSRCYDYMQSKTNNRISQTFQK